MAVESAWFSGRSYGHDNFFYCSAPDLDELLQLPSVDVPSVDMPVASLTSSVVISDDILEGLRMEDRKAEMSLRKTHQTTAWAIRAASSTSFFNRVSLIWLRQLQERLPPDEACLHQDINKLVAITEYSMDASLDVVKFAS